MYYNVPQIHETLVGAMSSCYDCSRRGGPRGLKYHAVTFVLPEKIFSRLLWNSEWNTSPMFKRVFLKIVISNLVTLYDMYMVITRTFFKRYSCIIYQIEGN
jgi:hypothetical protein